MFKEKTLTLRKQYILYALIFFSFFLASLLPLVLEPTGWLQHLNKISFIAFLGLLIFFSAVKKAEGYDERSRTNHLKANSFAFNAGLISVLGILFFIDYFARSEHVISMVPNVLIAGIWFLLLFRNIAFLVLEKMENK